MITGPISMSADFQVGVRTTSGRSFSIEELAAQCANKIVAVSDAAPEPIRVQAHEFKDRVEQMVKLYMQQAVENDRKTLYSASQTSAGADLLKTLKGK